MSHSIPEAQALVIRTPFGTVLHTGDWKLDPNPMVGQPTSEDAFRALDAEVWDLRVEVMGHDAARARAPEDGKRSPVEIY